MQAKRAHLDQHLQVNVDEGGAISIHFFARNGKMAALSMEVLAGHYSAEIREALHAWAHDRRNDAQIQFNRKNLARK